ncbi:MAG: pyruvate ferredoxin oxidoreductase, partial [Oscillospiraceae bacterium]|nr:pyruvate ferredoxin oxidoreductase [Oscillospiraceae bacterium]
EGTVYTNVNSSLQKAGLSLPTSNYIGGLGGRNISAEEIETIFKELKQEQTKVEFIGIGGEKE